MKDVMQDRLIVKNFHLALSVRAIEVIRPTFRTQITHLRPIIRLIFEHFNISAQVFYMLAIQPRNLDHSTSSSIEKFQKEVVNIPNALSIISRINLS